MNDLIDKLVKVSISISASAVSGESFNKILLIASAQDEAEAAPELGVYSSTKEVEEAGWGTSSATYRAASVAFANGADQLYIVKKKEEEETSAALNRANSMSGWYAIASAEDSETGKYDEIAVWAEANNKLFGFTADCSESVESPVRDSYNYTFGFGTKHFEEEGNNHFLAIAVLAKCLSFRAGSETWAYKQLTSIVADDFSSSEIEALDEAKLNYYVPCAGKDITLPGKTLSGEWIDVIRFRDYIANNIQTRVYNLFVQNPKVPYTNAGIALIQSQIIAALKEGQQVGGIAEDEYDGDGNLIPGFTTSVPSSSAVSAADKSSRTLSNCTFTARLANAIHLVEISGSLTA